MIYVIWVKKFFYSYKRLYKQSYIIDNINELPFIDRLLSDKRVDIDWDKKSNNVQTYPKLRRYSL